MTAPTGPDRTGVVARLDALEAAHKAATPGPWSAEPNYRLEKGCRCLSCWEPIEGSWATDPIDGPDCPEHGCWHNVAISQADATAIVAEHNSYGHLLAAVRGVLESHVPSHAYCVVCDKDRDVEALGNAFPCDHCASFCRECDFAWPCRTVSAVAAALGEAR